MLTIWKCTQCTNVQAEAGVAWDKTDGECYQCGRRVEEMKVFSEDEVRPLWEELRDARRIPSAIASLPGIGRALDAFPAPEEWVAAASSTKGGRDA